MKKVYVYQIGCGFFGKFGFEKLLQLSKKHYFVEFNGIAEINPERRKFIKKKAEEYKTKLKIFDHTFEMYKEAYQKSMRLKDKNKIMIYDTSPSELHYSHLLKSMKFGFWHLTEKPPALTKEEFEQELKFPKKWGCDFIEEENEVVLTAIDYLKRNKLKIKSIEIFRESSIGLQKILRGAFAREGIKGGCLLDKSIHEIYMFSFLNACKQEIKNIKLTKARANYLMIESLNKNNFLDIFGQLKKEISKDIATAESIVEGILETKKSKIPFKLHSSWLGISEEGKKISNKLKKLTNYEFVRKKQEEGMKLPYEDFRLFILNCDSVILYGEMKNKKLFVEKNKRIKEIQLLYLKEDALYRMLEKFIFKILKVKETNLENMRNIMKIIFDSKEKIWEDLRNKGNVKEIERTKNIVRKRIEELSKSSKDYI